MEIKSHRIIQLVEHLLPGGTERMAVNICNSLSDLGISVVLCPTRAEGDLKQFVKTDVECVCLKKTHTFDLFAFLRLIKVIRNFNINFIHAHSSTIYWAVACKIIYPRRIKIIWHDHNGNSHELKDSDRRIIQLFSKFISGIISVNETLRQWSLRNCYVKRENIIYLRNFPLMPFENIRAPANSDKLIIVCLANFRSQKNHQNLLRALNILIFDKNYKNIRLKLVGLDLKDGYSAAIVDYIENNQLEEYVEILGSISNPATILAGSNIGVLSSVSEGLPVSLLEYGLAGLPVIATNVGQCSEVLGNGKYGILVPSSNPVLLAEGIERYILEKDFALLMGAEFKKHVEQEYGAHKFMKEYLEFIYSL